MQFSNIKGSGVRKQKQDSGEETKVPQPGNNKSLGGCIPCRWAVEPEANKEIRAQANQLPEYIQEK
ncbi:hypothetical protein ES703_90313 [subsurface metagenome]